MAKTTTGIKVTLLVPLHDNDGQTFDLTIWDWWNDQLTTLVDAYTEMGGVRGSWRGIVDENRMITIVVQSMREVKAIRQLLIEAVKRFRQEAMYLEYHRVFFEEVRDDEQSNSPA